MLRPAYLEWLRRLALGDQRAVDSVISGDWRDSSHLDARTTALVRLACIVASEPEGPTLFAGIDRCHAAGIETNEILEMVGDISQVVGRERTRQATKNIRAADGIHA